MNPSHVYLGGVRSSTREQRQQQKEFIYVSRNERIRQVCHRKGVVLKKPVFATQDNITQQILSSTSSDFILGNLSNDFNSVLG